MGIVSDLNILDGQTNSAATIKTWADDVVAQINGKLTAQNNIEDNMGIFVINGKEKTEQDFVTPSHQALPTSDILTEWDCGFADHWWAVGTEEIDETTIVSFTNITGPGPVDVTDRYGITLPLLPPGTIEKISLQIGHKLSLFSEMWAATFPQVRPFLYRTSAPPITYEGTAISVNNPTFFAYTSQFWTTCPWTGAAWTEADLAELQIGFQGLGGHGTGVWISSFRLVIFMEGESEGIITVIPLMGKGLKARSYFKKLTIFYESNQLLQYILFKSVSPPATNPFANESVVVSSSLLAANKMYSFDAFNAVDYIDPNDTFRLKIFGNADAEFNIRDVQIALKTMISQLLL